MTTARIAEVYVEVVVEPPVVELRVAELYVEAVVAQVPPSGGGWGVGYVRMGGN